MEKATVAEMTSEQNIVVGVVLLLLFCVYSLFLVCGGEFVGKINDNVAI